MTTPVTEKPAPPTKVQKPAVIISDIGKLLDPKIPAKKMGEIDASSCKTDFIGRCLPLSVVKVKLPNRETKPAWMFSWGILEFRNGKGKIVGYYGGNSAVKRFVIFDNQGKPVAKIAPPQEGQSYFSIFALNDKDNKKEIGQMKITPDNYVIIRDTTGKKIGSTQKFNSKVEMKFVNDYDVSPATYVSGAIDKNKNLIGLGK